MQRTQSVDEYIKNAGQFRAELTELRKILRETELEECIKWGAPCYTIAGKNVVGLSSFKSYFGLWFHQGALLKDTSEKLVNAQEGKTKAMRQWRMRNASEIKPTIIKRYLKEAIANAKAGKEIKASRKKSLAIPDELSMALADNKRAQAAFSALTPGKQREYALYIIEAKRDDTRQRRVKKIVPMILNGGGLHDQYRNC